MRTTVALRVVTMVTLLLSGVRTATAQAELVRVRSPDPTIAALVTQASQLSPRFARLVDEIGQSDGIVYIQHGECRYGVPACMALELTIAGRNRVIRVLVDPRKAGCEHRLMEFIGHELSHTIEILREPSLRNYADVYNFYSRTAQHHPERGGYGVWETHEALETERAIAKEIRRGPPSSGRCRVFL